MKIGHYVPLFFSEGGIQSYVRRVVTGQRRSGHEVLIFERGIPAPPPAANHPEAGIISTVDDIDLLRQAHERKLDVLHIHAPVFASDDAANAYLGPGLVRTMHGHHAYCPSGSRYLALTRSPCPRRYTLAGCLWGHLVDHCGSVRPKQLIEGFRRVEQEQKFLPRCHTIAISRFSMTQMIRSGYDPAAISVIYNPAPASRPRTALAAPESKQAPTFLFLGRIVPGKGLRWLLEAAAQVRAHARFEIVGAGPEKPRLVQLTRDLGVEDQVAWSDWLEDEEAVFARLAAARALIFPSLWQEPAGLVNMEAAAAGRAVIASRVGGIPEYATALGHTLLVEPGDVAALAAAINRLAEDGPLAAQLGLAGWRQVTAGTLSLESHLNQLETVYTRMRRNGPSPTLLHP